MRMWNHSNPPYSRISNMEYGRILFELPLQTSELKMKYPKSSLIKNKKEKICVSKSLNKQNHSMYYLSKSTACLRAVMIH